MITTIEMAGKLAITSVDSATSWKYLITIFFILSSIDMYRGTIGIFLIIGSLLVLVVDKLTHSVSTMLDKIIFGYGKIQALNGIDSDHSYGLNTDMHIERSLIVVLILGILLYISSRKETE